MVDVKFFAMLRGIAGLEEKQYQLTEPTTLGELKKRIVADIPSLAEVFASRSILVSVNQEFAKDSDTVADGDEVAFLPPFSGG